jgi:YesN/AraC family two-component response regulator
MISEKVIICIDDEKAILVALEQQLNRAFNGEFIIEPAESAEEALELIEDFNRNNYEIPLIITDQVMPGMKGNEFIQVAGKKLNRTKFILLTGYADSEIINNLLKHQSLTIMHKPWNGEELIGLIKKSI